MDGHEVAKKIRKVDSKVKIIALIALAMHTEKEKCLESGMNDFLTKPISQEKFKAVLYNFGY